MSMTILPLNSSPDLPAPTFTADLSSAKPAIGPSPNEPERLGDFALAVLRRWKLVACTALLGAAFGVGVCFLQNPSYRARSAIEIQNINGDFMNMKQTAPTADNAQGTDQMTDIQTQTEILQSDDLAEATKAKLLAQSKSNRPTRAVLKKVADSLKVRGVGETRIIRVQADAPSAQLAANFVNGLIAEFTRRNLEARWEMMAAAEDSTRLELADMRQKLRVSEQEMQAYAADHGLVFTSERQDISDDRLKHVQDDLLHARADLAQNDARRQLASSANADSLPDVVKDTDLRELRAKLIDLRRQEAELSTVFKPDYSEVKKIRAQIDELQAACDRERDRIVNRVFNEYTESSQRERLLAASYAAAVAQATHDSQVGVQYDILKREVDANLAAYQEMLVKVKELSLATAIRNSNVRIIDLAHPPDRPYSPRMPLNAALGLLTGLTAGIGLVSIQERRNQNLRHPGEATVRLGMHELGVISSAGDNLVQAKSLSDDFRTLCTSIMFASEVERQPRAVVVTSFSPQEGKTTVASNLAMSLAAVGKRVLLIDGDLRKPRIHQLFELSNERGLGNLLEEGLPAGEAMRFVLPTRVPRLSVLCAGSFTKSPADLLFNPRLGHLLNTYRDYFDMVIVDSSPLMRIPDARLISHNADGVVLVARANRTARNAVAMACQRLTTDRSRVLGVVLNDWDGDTSPYPSYPS